MSLWLILKTTPPPVRRIGQGLQLLRAIKHPDLKKETPDSKAWSLRKAETNMFTSKVQESAVGF